MILAASCGSNIKKDQTGDIRTCIQWQMEHYPASELKDIYKNFFQDAFGPGHLISDVSQIRPMMEGFLREECERAKVEENGCLPYELIGWKGNFYRVNLSLINDGIISPEMYLDAFIRSISSFNLPDIEDWKKEWAEIEKEVHDLYPSLPNYENDKALIDKLLGNKKYVSHHSRIYNETYHPHYRLIERSIFENEFLPLIQKSQK